MYVQRTYRCGQSSQDLSFFQVRLKETDLYIGVDQERYTPELVKIAEELVWQYRNQLELYIQEDPEFRITFEPHFLLPTAPALARIMGQAAWQAGVGPMAAVAGAMAEAVGRGLLTKVREVMVENGGDIFLKIRRPRLVGIFAGTSPYSHRLALEIDPRWGALGVCTSSGTVGPSFSAGRADAAVILAPSTALADAVATAVGNVVQTPADVEKGLELARSIQGVIGAVVIKEDKLAAWGKVKLVPLNGDR
ncbi:MAG: UPF0280 family protein [Bacillota bacterium]